MEIPPCFTQRVTRSWTSWKRLNPDHARYNTRRFVGLDVHKDSIVVAVAEAGRAPARAVATVPFEFNALRRALERLGPKAEARCCYEAGPTGYGLARALHAAGWACDVIAPSLVPKKSGERIKTDRRDAAQLATNLRAGE